MLKKNLISFVLLLLIVIQSACVGSNVVSSNRLIQKRKFNKGFFINLPHFTKNEDASVSSEYKIQQKDSVEVVDSPKPIIESDPDLKTITMIKEGEGQAISERVISDSPLEIPERSTTLKEDETEISMVEPVIETEQDQENDFQWALILSLVLSIIGAALGITAIALESFLIIAPYLLVIIAFILILIYLNQTKSVSKSERLFFVLDLTMIAVALVIAGLFAFGWTFIFLIVSSALFILIVTISVVKFLKLLKSQQSNGLLTSNPKKVLLWLALSIILLFAISAILYNTVGAYSVLIILTALIAILFILSFIYSIAWARSVSGKKRIWPIILATISALFAVFSVMSFAGQL